MQYTHTPLSISAVGRKSDDPLSPAYVPSIFSFTTSQEIREIEQGLERYEAAISAFPFKLHRFIYCDN